MTDESSSEDGAAQLPDWTPPDIDRSKAHPARIYDYLLGGKDNFDVDREAAEVALKLMPELRGMARVNRAFLGRAVRHLAESGITQFLDIGTGIPGPGNTGEIARGIHPDARVVYVDYDPIVSAHSRALLAGADPELTAIVQADVREPKTILDNGTVHAVLDFDKPVAVLMVAVLHFVSDAEDAHGTRPSSSTSWPPAAPSRSRTPPRATSPASSAPPARAGTTPPPSWSCATARRSPASSPAPSCWIPAS